MTRPEWLADLRRCFEAMCLPPGRKMTREDHAGAIVRVLAEIDRLATEIAPARPGGVCPTCDDRSKSTCPSCGPTWDEVRTGKAGTSGDKIGEGAGAFACKSVGPVVMDSGPSPAPSLSSAPGEPDPVSVAVEALRKEHLDTTSKSHARRVDYAVASLLLAWDAAQDARAAQPAPCLACGGKRLVKANGSDIWCPTCGPRLSTESDLAEARRLLVEAAPHVPTPVRKQIRAFLRAPNEAGS